MFLHCLKLVVQTLKVLNAFGVLDGTVEGYTFRIIWTDVVMEMSVRFTQVLSITLTVLHDRPIMLRE